MESKCPCCEKGRMLPCIISDGVVVVVYCTECSFRCDTAALPRITAAMDSERRPAELVEAVRWLEETLDMLLSKVVILEAFGAPDDTEEICESFYAARAAVDALVGEG